VIPPEHDDDWLDHLDPDAMPPGWALCALLVLSWVAMIGALALLVWRMM